jgi:hypothetical protein
MHPNTSQIAVSRAPWQKRHDRPRLITDQGPPTWALPRVADYAAKWITSGYADQPGANRQLLSNKVVTEISAATDG